MKKKSISIILFFLILILIIFDLQTGSTQIQFNEIINHIFSNNNNNDTSNALIINQIRLPRILVAILSGIALPVAGLLMQSLLRNPLAGPYILGVNSGASFAIALLLLGASYFNISSIITAVSTQLAAVVGAMAVLMLIVYLSTFIPDNSTILIIGIFISSVIAAIIDLMQFFSQNNELKRFVVWSMGSLDGATFSTIKLLFPIISVLSMLVYLFAKKLDIIYLGDENAKTLGVNTKSTRIQVFLLTGILTGIITAICGPISFIGLAVPHLTRLLYRTASHLWLIGGSMLIGIILMLASDIISHSFGSQFIPINTITAIWGIPVIIYILLKNK